jgi:lipid-binding SYLF domain-containing protein
MPRRRLNTRAAAVLLTFALAGCAHDQKQTAAQIQHENAVAAQVLAQGAAGAETFLSHSQTEGFRNMLGGVRGVFIAPKIEGAAAIVGYDTGTGFLMRRQGKDWSDPLF